MVYADRIGTARPGVEPAPGGVVWVDRLQDLRAAHAAGMPSVAWLRGCAAVCGLAREDPLPVLRGQALARRVEPDRRPRQNRVARRWTAGRAAIARRAAGTIRVTLR